MGEEPSQIALDHYRDEVGRDVNELQDRVKSITDWRYQFSQHPWTGVGVAFGGGLLLAQVGRGNGHEAYGERYENYQRYEKRRRTSEMLSAIKATLLVLAGRWTKEFLNASIPGFSEEYSRHLDVHARDQNEAVGRQVDSRPRGEHQ